MLCILASAFALHAPALPAQARKRVEVAVGEAKPRAGAVKPHYGNPVRGVRVEFDRVQVLLAEAEGLEIDGDAPKLVRRLDIAGEESTLAGDRMLH